MITRFRKGNWDQIHHPFDVAAIGKRKDEACVGYWFVPLQLLIGLREHLMNPRGCSQGPHRIRVEIREELKGQVWLPCCRVFSLRCLLAAAWSEGGGLWHKALLHLLRTRHRRCSRHMACKCYPIVLGAQDRRWEFDEGSVFSCFSLWLVGFWTPP